MSLRQEKLGKGERASNSETFRRNPAGSQSRLAELGQQPEASLAWGGATLTAKRRQPGQRPCDRAPKTKIARSLRCGHKRGPCRSRYTWSHRARSVLPGSESTGNRHEGSPGTWETPSSPPSFPDRETGTDNSPMPPVARRRPTGANLRRNGGIAKRRQRSAARRTAGSRSVP